MIYILQLDHPLGTSKHTAQFYIGYAANRETLQRRIEYHRLGKGSRFTQAAVERGIPIHLIAILEGDKSEERRLKNKKNTPRIVRKLKEQGSLLWQP